MDKVRQYLYYFIIGIISFISLVFLPMLGSTMGLGWNVPDTVVGWIVWVAVKVIVAILNVLIFHSFMKQAKINIKENERYLEGQKILRTIRLKNYIPRSPKEWNIKQYGTKGVSIFIMTALTTIALSQAILTFDWISMLTYLFTIILGLIFGVIQMKTAEEYWTDEFWKYAKMVEEDLADLSSEYNTGKVRKCDLINCIRNFKTWQKVRYNRLEVGNKNNTKENKYGNFTSK